MSNCTTRTAKRTGKTSRQAKSKKTPHPESSEAAVEAPPEAGSAEVQKVPEVESNFVLELREGWLEELGSYARDLSTDNLYALRNLAELICCAEHHGGRASKGLARLGQALNRCAHGKGPFANIDLLDRAADDAATHLEVLPTARRIAEHGLSPREMLMENVTSHLAGLPTKIVKRIGSVVAMLNCQYQLKPVRLAPEGAEWSLAELRELRRPAERR